MKQFFSRIFKDVGTLESTECGFISSPNAFKRLVSFAAITVLLTHPGMYFTLVCLVCSGACLSIRVDKMV